MERPQDNSCQLLKSITQRQVAVLLGRAESFRRHLRKMGVLPTLGWLLGATVILTGCSSSSDSEASTPISPIPGDQVTAEEVENYATAVLAIEGSRKTAYNDIQQRLGNQKVPDVTCNQASTLVDLPKDIQDIAVKYCNTAKQLSEEQGLTISRFNTITVSAPADPELERRIQNELIRLQRGS